MIGWTAVHEESLITQFGLFSPHRHLGQRAFAQVRKLEQVQNAYNFYWPENEVHQRLDQGMTRAFRSVHEMAENLNVYNRLAAYLVSVERVAKAMKLRGWV